jgi:hypothetical protein
MKCVVLLCVEVDVSLLRFHINAEETLWDPDSQSSQIRSASLEQQGGGSPLIPVLEGRNSPRKQVGVGVPILETCSTSWGNPGSGSGCVISLWGQKVSNHGPPRPVSVTLR